MSFWCMYGFGIILLTLYKSVEYYMMWNVCWQQKINVDTQSKVFFHEKEGALVQKKKIQRTMSQLLLLLGLFVVVLLRKWII